MGNNPLSVALQLHKAGWEAVPHGESEENYYVYHPHTSKVRIESIAMWKALRNLGHHDQQQRNKKSI